MTTTWMPFYTGDYVKNTMHLSTEEHGAYLLLIIHYWTHGKIPRNMDLLKNITKINPKKLTNIIKFFRIEEGYYIHDRIEHELKQALENKEKQRKRTEAATEAAAIARRNRNVSVTDSVTSTTSPSSSPSPSSKQDNIIRKDGLFKEDLVDKDWDVMKKIQYESILKAQSNAPGWDIEYLAQQFNSWIKEIPKNPDRAFPAWCGKFTKGKRP